MADGVGGELVVVQGSRATWSQVWVPSRALARSERNGSMPNTPFVTDRAARGRTTARRYALETACGRETEASGPTRCVGEHAQYPQIR